VSERERAALITHGLEQIFQPPINFVSIGHVRADGRLLHIIIGCRKLHLVFRSEVQQI
jgi:hypothetical protein